MDHLVSSVSLIFVKENTLPSASHSQRVLQMIIPTSGVSARPSGSALPLAEQERYANCSLAGAGAALASAFGFASLLAVGAALGRERWTADAFFGGTPARGGCGLR